MRRQVVCGTGERENGGEVMESGGLQGRVGRESRGQRTGKLWAGSKEFGAGLMGQRECGIGRHRKWEIYRTWREGTGAKGTRSMGELGQGDLGREDWEYVGEGTMRTGGWGCTGEKEQENGAAGTGRLGQRRLRICGRGNSENGVGVGKGEAGSSGERGLEILGRVDRRMGKNGEGLWGRGVDLSFCVRGTPMQERWRRRLRKMKLNELRRWKGGR